MAELKFPDGFLWGASTAAYQVEGGIESVDWAQAAREGKVPSAGQACDFYHRFESDFDVAVNLGMNAQRFSIEWARIEPEEGTFDEREVEHYRTVFAALKAGRPQIQVGIAKHNIFFESNANPFNRLQCAVTDWFWNHRFLRLIAGYQDFIGLNHYHHRKFGITKHEQESALRSDMGWELHPMSLYRCLIALKRYNHPLYVSEHGLADAADIHRPEFIQNAARALHRAIGEGAPVKGYFHWSLLDNYEWTEGFTKRFGLVEVDYATQERRIRKSAYVYKQLCERNALLDPAVNVGDSLFSDTTRSS